MLSVHTTTEEFENATITSNFGFVVEENSGTEITLFSAWCHRGFQKAPFSECFPSTIKQEAGVFKFLRFEERFRKVPFSWRIGVDARPNRVNKTPFTNSSGVVWKGAVNSISIHLWSSPVKDQACNWTKCSVKRDLYLHLLPFILTTAQQTWKIPVNFFKLTHKPWRGSKELYYSWIIFSSIRHQVDRELKNSVWVNLVHHVGNTGC